MRHKNKECGKQTSSGLIHRDRKPCPALVTTYYSHTHTHTHKYTHTPFTCRYELWLQSFMRERYGS